MSLTQILSNDLYILSCLLLYCCCIFLFLLLLYRYAMRCYFNKMKYIDLKKIFVLIYPFLVCIYLSVIRIYMLGSLRKDMNHDYNCSIKYISLKHALFIYIFLRYNKTLLYYICVHNNIQGVDNSKFYS